MSAIPCCRQDSHERRLERRTVPRTIKRFDVESSDIERRKSWVIH